MAFTDYQEAEGSPQWKIDRTGSGTCTRKVYLRDTVEGDQSAYTSKIGLLLTDIFPNPYNGFATATAPLFSNMQVVDCSIDPFQGAAISDLNGVAVYSQYAITVNYKNFTFVTHKIAYSGEFVTWPSKALQWQNPIRRRKNAGLGLFGFKKIVVEDRSVGNDTIAGIIIPQIEHTYSYEFAVNIDFTAIRRCMGKVNAYPLGNAPPGTVLFAGASIDQNVTATALTAWTNTQALKMEYKFIEKNMNPDNPQAPVGWNHFLRPETSKFERMVRGIPQNVADVVFHLNRAIGPNDTEIEFSVVLPGNGDYTAWQEFVGTPPFNIIVNQEKMKVVSCTAFDVAAGTWLATVLRGTEGTQKTAQVFGQGVVIADYDIYEYEDFNPLFDLSVGSPY